VDPVSFDTLVATALSQVNLSERAPDGKLTGLRSTVGGRLSIPAWKTKSYYPKIDNSSSLAQKSTRFESGNPLQSPTTDQSASQPLAAKSTGVRPLFDALPSGSEVSLEQELFGNGELAGTDGATPAHLVDPEPNRDLSSAPNFRMGDRQAGACSGNDCR